MNLSRTAKIIVALGLLVGAIVWVALLDLGINAGRVHYGVHVDDLDLGGLTLEQAQDMLQKRGEEMRFRPVELSAEGVNCSFIPDDLGWGPKPKSTAERAREVGFDGGITEAAADRLQAWLSGVEVEWAGSALRKKVTPHIDHCEKQANAIGLEVDRPELRRVIRDAIVTWPREIVQVPVEIAG